MWTGVVLSSVGLAYFHYQRVMETLFLWPSPQEPLSVRVLPSVAEADPSVVRLLISNHGPGPASFQLARVGWGRVVPVKAGRLLAGETTTLAVGDEAQWHPLSPHRTLYLHLEHSHGVIRMWLNAIYADHPRDTGAKAPGPRMDRLGG